MIYSQPLILKFVAGASKAGEFSGLGSTWTIDRTSERIAKGSFQKSLADIAAGTRGRVPVLYEHNAQNKIGVVTHAEETNEGLAVSGQLVLGDPVTDRVHKLLMAGALGMSVGFFERPNAVTRDQSGTKTYTDVDWAELSIVGIPANAQAVVHHVRSLDLVSHAEFKAALLEGTALPPMPRGLVNKLASIAYRDALEEDDSDAEAEAAFMRALSITKQIYRGK